MLERGHGDAAPAVDARWSEPRVGWTMTNRRPSVVDLKSLDGESLALALRELAELARDAAYRLVLDLGSRRVIPGPVVEALLAVHRAIIGAGGRCAVIVGPAVAAQIAAAHPEGVLWAADADAGLLALGDNGPGAAAEWDHPAGLLSLAGVLDLRSLRAIEPALLKLRSATGEVVVDLERVTFADVVGLRTVLLAASAAGARVEVRGASAQARRLIARLGWHAYLSAAAGDRAEDTCSSVLRAAIRRELAGCADPDRWAVIATDMAGCVTHWNRAAERLYGWARFEALGRPITELTVGPEDQELAREIMQSVETAGAWEGDFEVQRKDESTITAHVRDTVIPDAHGRPVGLLGVSVSAPQRSARVLRAA
jgi:PAS domain S-box-containing protein